jgi:hypothetical protein
MSMIWLGLSMGRWFFRNVGLLYHSSNSVPVYSAYSRPVFGYGGPAGVYAQQPVYSSGISSTGGLGGTTSGTGGAVSNLASAASEKASQAVTSMAQKAEELRQTGQSVRATNQQI